MGQKYEQLSVNERVELYRMHKEGRSMRAIAAALGRTPSTVSRELARNSEPTKVWSGGYQPIRAQALADRRRRWDARFKLARNEGLCAYVHERLQAGWSPEQIAGQLKPERLLASLTAAAQTPARALRNTSRTGRLHPEPGADS